MRFRTGILLTGIALALVATPAPGQQGQGRGQGKAAAPARAQQPAARGGNEGAQGERARANRSDPDLRGRGAERAQPPGRGPDATAGGAVVRGRGRAVRAEARAAARTLPQPFRDLERSRRMADRFALGAAGYAVANGLAADALALQREDDRVLVRNRDGDLLFELDDDRARDLGSWDVRLLGDRGPTESAPAFCRSGEGHPVWGREWCLDKGFGLGRNEDRVWGRATVDDVVFGRIPDRDRVDRSTLEEILGRVVFGRLALHALSLGFGEPLVGRWVAEPQAPRLLLLYSGDEPVAELVDLDRDNDVDVLYVTHYRR